MTKKLTFNKVVCLSRSLAMCAVVGALPFLSIQSAQAVQVDSEVILLVDVTKEMSNSDFLEMTQGIANSFRSSSVIGAIEGGHSGSIAVSLVFFTQKKKYETAVDWVQISDSVSAEAFALSVAAATRPKDHKKNALGDTINNITGDFGTETGEAANGFESAVQMINVIGHSKDNHSPPGKSYDQNVKNASLDALAAGVDVINAVAITQHDSSMAAYFDSFVIGGSVGGQQGSVTSAASYANFSATLTPTLTASFSAAAATTVPEPTTGLLVFSSCALLFVRRR